MLLLLPTIALAVLARSFAHGLGVLACVAVPLLLLFAQFTGLCFRSRGCVATAARSLLSSPGCLSAAAASWPGMGLAAVAAVAAAAVPAIQLRQSVFASDTELLASRLRVKTLFAGGLRNE